MDRDVGAALRARGYDGRAYDIERVGALRAALEARRRAGQLDEALYAAYLTEFDDGPAAALPGARSVVVVAVPSPPVRFTFSWRGKTFRLLVPPTYLLARETDARAAAALAAALAPSSWRLAPAAVPKKLLAVRAGLAAYGRNNVAYVAGMGSFHRLAAFYSDMPAPPATPWRGAAALERCASCDACLKQCPTGAIAAERFLLHAERCLTFHNEMSNDVPFADWLEPAWHDCVVGCLRCQLACPENKDVRAWVEEGAAFSAEETEALAAGVPLAALPGEARAKLERTGLAVLADVLPRNLRVIFDRDG